MNNKYSVLYYSFNLDMKITRRYLSILLVLFLGIGLCLILKNSSYLFEFRKSVYINGYTEFVDDVEHIDIENTSSYDWEGLDSIYKDYSTIQRASYLSIMDSEELETLNILDVHYLNLKSNHLIAILTKFIENTTLKSEHYTKNDWVIVDDDFGKLVSLINDQLTYLSPEERFEYTKLVIEYNTLKHGDSINNAVEFVNEVIQNSISIVKEVLK